ncbi:hypothetical protein Q9233_015179, partial [Columba guinea]
MGADLLLSAPAGCRCPPGQLLQDGECVAVAECRCGLPAANSSRELRPGQAAELDCHNCVCIRGAFNCSQDDCDGERFSSLSRSPHTAATSSHPVPTVDCLWSPWSPWSPCSVTCGVGERLSHRRPLRQRLYEGAECLGPPTRRTPCSLPDCRESPRSPSTPGAGKGGDRTVTCRVLAQGRGNNPCLLHRGGASAGDGDNAVSCGTCSLSHGRALAGTQHTGQLRAELPGHLQRAAAQLQRIPVPRLHLPARPLPQQHRPLCPSRTLRMLAPGAAAPGERRQGVPLVLGGVPLHRRRAEPCFPVGQAGSEWQEECKTCRCIDGQAACTAGCAPLSCPEEPYLQSLCECCSYRLDPTSPVRVLQLPCPGGRAEPVVLPVIHSCQCSSCQGSPVAKPEPIPLAERVEETEVLGCSSSGQLVVPKVEPIPKGDGEEPGTVGEPGGLEHSCSEDWLVRTVKVEEEYEELPAGSSAEDTLTGQPPAGSFPHATGTPEQPCPEERHC